MKGDKGMDYELLERTLDYDFARLEQRLCAMGGTIVDGDKCFAEKYGSHIRQEGNDGIRQK